MPEIHIEIRCEGDGFPTPQELAKRHELEEALEAAEIGDVVDAGGGEGVMDVFVEVDDANAAVAMARSIVKKLGLADRATVQVTDEAPLSDDADN